MRQVVVFTAHKRQDYLRKSLESWGRARGIENAVLDFHIEPSEEFGAVCEVIYHQVARQAGELTLHPNPALLGVQRNPYQALYCGFSSYWHEHTGGPRDFVILAEDDFVVSDDVLEYFAWAQREYYHDPRALAVSATQFDRQGDINEALLIKGWTGWVWGTWRDRWENILKPDWTFAYEHGGWDWRIIKHWCGVRGYGTVTPAVSRSQHIGQYGGVHTNPDTFRDHQSRCFEPLIAPAPYIRRFPDDLVDVAFHHTGT